MSDKALTASIDIMRDTLAMARALVRGGRQVDLAGLEEEAAAICAALASSPPAQALPLRPAMLALVAELDALTVTMPQA